MNRKLGRHFSSDEIIRGILVVQAITGLLMIAGALSGLLGLWTTATLLFVYVSSVGCMSPNTTAMALAAHGEKAGSASALIGSLQFTLAATASSLVGAANNTTALPMAALIAGCGVSAFVLYRALVVKTRIAVSA